MGTRIPATPASLTPNPLTVSLGATGVLTATLSPAPAAAGNLTVASANPGVATVPASIAYAVGQTSVSVPVTAAALGSTVISVSANGGSASSTVQVAPQPPAVTSLIPQTLSLTQGSTGALTLSINPAQLADTPVPIESGNAAIASAPGSVNVPAGQLSAQVAVSGHSPGTTQLAASLNGSEVASTVSVTPGEATVVSVRPTASAVALGASAALELTISAAQSTPTTVSLEAAPAGVVAAPTAVTVPAGATRMSFNVGASALGSALLRASLNGSSAEAALQVLPAEPKVTSLSPSLLKLATGATGELTLSLNAAQSTNTEVALAVDNANVQAPVSVTVPAGRVSAPFTLTGVSVGNAQVTATLGESSASAAVEVNSLPAQVLSLKPESLALAHGATCTIILALNAAQPSDTVVALAASAASVLQLPSNITVPAGKSEVAFPITGLNIGSATITATLGASSAAASIHVSAASPGVTGITPPTLILPKGVPAVLRVEVSSAPTAPTAISLSSSGSAVLLPASAPVAAGALQVEVPLLTLAEGSATVTASLNGRSASATVSVTAPELVRLTLSPQNHTSYVGETQPFSASGAFSDGSSQDLSSLDSATVTVALAARRLGAVAVRVAVPAASAETLNCALAAPAGIDPTPANNQMSFGGGVIAPVITASATALTVKVPTTAQSGPVRVTNARGTAIGPVFTVTREEDFALVASPAELKLYQGSSTTASLAVSSLGTQPFTGLVSLSVGALPAGVSATLAPQSLSASQSGAVNFNASASAAPGTYSVSVTGTSLVSGVLQAKVL